MSILHASFDFDSSTLNFGTQDGYNVLNLDRFEQSFETSQSGVGIIERFTIKGTAMILMVGSGDKAGSSPRKLLIIDINLRRTVYELSFQSSILSCAINSQFMIICLISQIHIIEVNSMTTVKIINTQLNTNGIMTSSKTYPIRLAYPTSTTLGKFTVITIDDSNIISTTADLSCDAHKSPLVCLQMDSMGTFIATASETGTIIRVFDARSGQRICEFRRGIKHASITYLAFCPFNHYLAAGSSSGTVHLFHINMDDIYEKPAEADMLEPMDPYEIVEPRNIFGKIMRAAVISVQMEIKNGVRSTSRATYMARVPSGESPISMGLIDAGDGDKGDRKLFVVTATGFLYRFCVPISLSSLDEDCVGSVNPGVGNPGRGSPGPGKSEELGHEPKESIQPSSSPKSFMSKIRSQHNDAVYCILEDEKYLLDHDF
jgi:WD40 repeat protein